MDNIREWLAGVDWRRVRRWSYGVLTVAMPLLIAYGVLDHETAALWVAFGGAVLGHGVAAINERDK